MGCEDTLAQRRNGTEGGLRRGACGTGSVHDSFPGSVRHCRDDIRTSGSV